MSTYPVNRGAAPALKNHGAVQALYHDVCDHLNCNFYDIGAESQCASRLESPWIAFSGRRLGLGLSREHCILTFNLPK